MQKSSLIAGFVIVCLAFAGAVAAADNGPKLNTNWYGYIKLDASYDQNLTSHGNFVMWVQPEAVDQNDAQYNMTANETRFGLSLSSTGDQKYKVGGKVEFDLYAGVGGGSIAENKAMLQLRHAYFTIESGNTKLLAGQSWDIISPLNPATLNYPVLWGVGNIGYRRPQISLFHNIPAGDNTSVTVAGGFFRTIGNDLTPTFSLALGETAEGADDGTDAAIPSIQTMFEVNHKMADGGKIRAGVSSLYGKLKAETNLGNSENYESWAFCGHLQVDFSKQIGIAGEAYTGSNLGSYFGGILQNSTIDGVNSTGGWSWAWLQATPKVKFGLGFGIDDPSDEDLTTGRSKNQAYFGNVRYSIVPQVTVGLELSQWQTDYLNAESAKDFRVQTSFILSY